MHTPVRARCMPRGEGAVEGESALLRPGAVASAGAPRWVCEGGRCRWVLALAPTECVPAPAPLFFVCLGWVGEGVWALPSSRLVCVFVFVCPPPLFLHLLNICMRSQELLVSIWGASLGSISLCCLLKRLRVAPPLVFEMRSSADRRDASYSQHRSHPGHRGRKSKSRSRHARGRSHGSPHTLSPERGGEVQLRSRSPRRQRHRSNAPPRSQRTMRSSDAGREAHVETTSTLHKRIEAVYRLFAPEKLNNVEYLLSKYRGQEQQLWEAVCQKYGLGLAPMEVEHAQAGGDGRQQNAMEAEVVRSTTNPADSLPLQARIVASVPYALVVVALPFQVCPMTDLLIALTVGGAGRGTRSAGQQRLHRSKGRCRSALNVGQSRVISKAVVGASKTASSVAHAGRRGPWRWRRRSKPRL